MFSPIKLDVKCGVRSHPREVHVIDIERIRAGEGDRSVTAKALVLAGGKSGADDQGVPEATEYEGEPGTPVLVRASVPALTVVVPGISDGAGEYQHTGPVLGQATRRRRKRHRR